MFFIKKKSFYYLGAWKFTADVADKPIPRTDTTEASSRVHEICHLKAEKIVIALLATTKCAFFMIPCLQNFLYLFEQQLDQLAKLAKPGLRKQRASCNDIFAWQIIYQGNN